MKGTLMNVLLIHNYYRHFGGEDMAADNDFRLLKEHGVNVQRYSRHSKETLEYGFLDKLRFPLRTINSEDTIRDIKTVLNTFRADVAYLHNLYPLISPSVYEALLDANVPIVQVLHDYRPFCANGWQFTDGQSCERCTGGRHWNAVIHKCVHHNTAISAIYAAALWNLRRSGCLDSVAAFICPSEHSRIQAVRNGIHPNKLIVRPHFIEVEKIIVGEGEGGYFLFLGRLSQEKGVWTLLRAAEQLKKAQFIVAGAGSLEGDIRVWLSDHGMNNVKLVGFQSGEAKNELIRNASALVVPSEAGETFGISVTEAFAAGRPVVVSNMGSLPYLVDDGETGRVFPSQDFTALARCLQSLTDNPLLAAAMGAKGRKIAEQHFTPQECFRVLMNVFEGVIGTDRRSTVVI